MTVESVNQKTEFNNRYNALESEYANWKSAHQDLSTYVNPTRGRFDDEPNKGKMIDHQILLDSHATGANRTLASGMQSGMTNPASPWIRLTLKDKELADSPDVRKWLDTVTELMLGICANSNVYDVFYSMYEELGQFGTAAAMFEEDFDTVIRGRNYTAGEYVLGIDAKGRVNAFGRQYQMQVSQMVEAFGYDNCSSTVQGYFTNNQKDNWVKIRMLIESNDSRDVAFVDNLNMEWRVAYWEVSDGTSDFLRLSGYEEFPTLGPRWDTPTTDMIYGYGPGWHALGNIKQLQKTTLDKLLAQEKLHDPPMQADASVEGHVDLLPGGVTKTSSNTPNSGLRPAYQINPSLESFIEMIQTLKDAIDKDFFVTVFLMMINFDKTNMTATEVARREQENIMMMGPLLNKVNSEMLDPFVERLYGIMERNLLIPPPPEEIAGLPIEVEYISILAQAQKAVGVNSINRVIAFVGQASAYNPNVLDVINWDEAAREVNRLEGGPEKIMLEQKVVNQIRDQRARAEQMRAMAEMANSTADTAKKFSEAETDKSSALTGVMDAVRK